MMVIIDYQAGNIASVKKAFEYLGAETIVTSDPDQAARADKLVLPGVGHFAATKTLADSGMRDVIAESIDRGVPFLGICVGMQWLFAGSEEAPGVRGLGLWDEVCERFPQQVKSPHVGWNSLEIVSQGPRMLKGVEANAFVYFTHSYRVPLAASTVAECAHGGWFSAAVERDNVYGVQFHPEKSGTVGLRILKNFCQC